MTYSRENVAPIHGLYDIKYEFDIDSIVINQEPNIRNWQAITNNFDPENEFYTLQPCDPREVSGIIFHFHKNYGGILL